MINVVKICLVAIFTLISFQVRAQNVEFMGVDLCGVEAKTIYDLVADRGYEYVGEDETSVLFEGDFAGHNAYVMVMDYITTGQVASINISIDEMTPKAMEALYADLLVKFKRKYPHLENATYTDEKGVLTYAFVGHCVGIALQKRTSSKKGMKTGQLSILDSCSPVL